ncbi:MAG TPA: hypothetical protein VIN00_07570, partial [Candidatus Dormibacteraeota bacterium]
MTLAGDLEAHRSAQDVKQLIDDVGVNARRRAVTRRSLDAIDSAARGTRIVIQQRLRRPVTDRCGSKSILRTYSTIASLTFACLEFAMVRKRRIALIPP